MAERSGDTPSHGHADEARPALARAMIPLYRALGAGVAIGLMEVFATVGDEPVSRVPFVTSIVLVMAIPNSPPARPRALIGGHLLSCFAGWLSVIAFGSNEVASAVGVGAATLGMIVSGTLHPPAGIDPFLMATQALPVRWIVSPVLIGTVLLAGFAWIWAKGERRFLCGLAADRRTRAVRVAPEDK